MVNCTDARNLNSVRYAVGSHVVSGLILTGVGGVLIDSIIYSMSSSLLFFVENIISPHIFSEMT